MDTDDMVLGGLLITLLVAVMCWASLLTTGLITMAGHRRIQFNPVNVQQWDRNHAATKALAYHGILKADHDGMEYGFWRKGRWCSLYRSIKRRR